MGGTKNVAAALDEVNKKCKYDMSGNHESPNTKSHREVKKTVLFMRVYGQRETLNGGMGKVVPIKKVQIT